MENYKAELWANLFKIVLVIIWFAGILIFTVWFSWTLFSHFHIPSFSWKTIFSMLYILFAYFVMLLGIYASLYVIFKQPIKVSIIDNQIHLKFLFKNLVFDVNLIKGYSTTAVRGRYGYSGIVCLYFQNGEVFDIANAYMNTTKFRDILVNLGKPYLGGETYKVKYFKLFIREYKYL